MYMLTNRLTLEDLKPEEYEYREKEELVLPSSLPALYVDVFIDYEKPIMVSELYNKIRPIQKDSKLIHIPNIPENGPFLYTFRTKVLGISTTSGLHIHEEWDWMNSVMQDVVNFAVVELAQFYDVCAAVGLSPRTVNLMTGEEFIDFVLKQIPQPTGFDKKLQLLSAMLCINEGSDSCLI